MKVLIATPRKGGISEEFETFKTKLIQLAHLGAFPGIEFHWRYCSGCSINMARNILAYEARSNGMDKLLFVDMDVMPEAKHVEAIVSHDVPVVAGLYMKRNGHMSWLGRPLPKPEENAEHLVEYEDLPTGFMCIDVKKCLDVLVDKMPELRFDAVDDPDAEKMQYQTMHEFFPMGITGPSSWREKFLDIREKVLSIGRKDFLEKTLPLRRHEALVVLKDITDILARDVGSRIFRGEDYHFCWLVRKAGMKIYADWSCFIHHKGDAVYPMNPDFILGLADKIRAKQKS